MSGTKNKHGMRYWLIYGVWRAIIQRCNNPNCKAYENYGGRGIKVCERWLKFENFYADMGNRPTERHSIGRLNNDGDYCLENCVWAIKSAQVRNTRRSVYISYNGETKIAQDWSDEAGISKQCFRVRLKLGWSMEKIMNTKARAYNVKKEW